MNKTELLETHLCHHQAAKNTTADQDLSRIPTRTDHNFSRPQFFQAPAEGISRRPCKHTLLLSRLQHKKPCSSPVHPHRPQFSLNHFEEYRRNPAKYTGAPVQGIQNMNKTELLETHLCHHQAAKNTTADQDLSRIPTRTDHNFSRLTSRNIHATCKIHRCSCTAHPKN